MWAAAGKDYKLYLFKFDNSTPDDKAQYGKALSLHYDEITDCLEIKEPKSIVTCSMDRSLVLYDVDGGFLIRAIKMAHENSIN